MTLTVSGPRYDYLCSEGPVDTVWGHDVPILLSALCVVTMRTLALGGLAVPRKCRQVVPTMGSLPSSFFGQSEPMCLVLRLRVSLLSAKSVLGSEVSTYHH